MAFHSARNSTLLVALFTVASIALLLGIPFALRPPSARLVDPLELVIVSPHDEGAKHEFERAFCQWHQAHFGRPVRIEWPNVGGGGDITRYVESNFAPHFRRVLGPVDSRTVQWVEVDRPGSTSQPNELTQKARALRDVGVGIDIFFGAGDFEHARFKAAGYSAPFDLPTSSPDFPGEPGYLAVVPPDLNGQPLYDRDHYWYGAVLTRLGIVSNRVVCQKLGLTPPRSWADLAQPGFRDQLALADPNFSGSAKLCYEMVLQQNGWDAGWRILTNIAANGRYFASGSVQVALDVSRCEAAAGMIIDYYGRTQVDYVGNDLTTGQPRLQYVSPTGATATTPDPIAILRGAPHRVLAERFVQFVLSVEGQKLWLARAGTHGGPEKFALYRPPIRPDVYDRFADDFIVRENPYTEPVALKVNSQVRDTRFGLLGVLMRAAFIDNDDLLRRVADRARTDGPDSPAGRAFAELPFPEGDIRSPAPGTLWDWAGRFNKKGANKEAIAAELTKLFRAKYEKVLNAATPCP